MHIPILGPVATLICWTLLIQVWLYATRLPALRKAGINLVGRRGSRPGGMDGVLPDHVQWKAHNYNHLLEQPTIFYAACLSLAILGFGSGLNAVLAWLYVGLRIAHSLVQVTENIIVYRFALHSLASAVLAVLAIRLAANCF